ncbi:MAG: glutamate--cysteine ligase [Rhodospirillales bacterium]|nr:glutamate--cysteine ligase [Rhodospirillales bacterium]
MSNPGDADATPIASERQLVEYLAVGCKQETAFRLGTEHEKFGFYTDDLAVPPYERDPGRRGGIQAMLEGLTEPGWTPIIDSGNVIGLKGPTGAAISLEPAGQLELSGAPVEDLHQTRDEFEAHFAAVRRVAGPLRIGFALAGFHPLARREDMRWMPKGRYAIMRAYMPKVGTRGLDMMTRTCTVQVNLDYASEADMVEKLRVSLCLQPLATALFANSPFVEGKPTGFLSNRAHAWTDTDNERSGIPEVFFEDGFGFERYVRWVVDAVPMYFVYRNASFIDASGRSFRAFMQGRLGIPEAGPATLGDFADHLTTVFTDVRLKRFLEMRGADAGSLEMMLAQSALWVGLLYDGAALAAAKALVARHGWRDLVALRGAVPRTGIATPWRGGTLRDLARDVIAIARDGLAARARKNAAGEDERIYLAPLEAIAAGAPSQAEHWLERYHGPWRGDASAMLREAAI